MCNTRSASDRRRLGRQQQCSPADSSPQDLCESLLTFIVRRLGRQQQCSPADISPQDLCESLLTFIVNAAHHSAAQILCKPYTKPMERASGLALTGNPVLFLLNSIWTDAVNHNSTLKDTPMMENRWTCTPLDLGSLLWMKTLHVDINQSDLG